MTAPRSPRPDPVPEGDGREELPQPAAEGRAEGLRRTNRISSEQLFAGGAAELQINHRGVLYRLKQTALGKLILTK